MLYLPGQLLSYELSSDQKEIQWMRNDKVQHTHHFFSGCNSV